MALDAWLDRFWQAPETGRPGIDVIEVCDCLLLSLVMLLVGLPAILMRKYLGGSPPSPVVGVTATPRASVVTVERRRSIANVNRCADADLLGLPECDGLGS